MIERGRADITAKVVGDVAASRHVVEHQGEKPVRVKEMNSVISF